MKHYEPPEMCAVGTPNGHWDSNSFWEQFAELIYLYDLSPLRGSFNICLVIFAKDFLSEEKKIFLVVLFTYFPRF